ncbi:hypothetical protein B0H19DRAFT_1349971 [Mycena capillaripes]|nr:hypothetical protein B0H19DRAFT_1349971 [Mycena capillaripes]
MDYLRTVIWGGKGGGGKDRGAAPQITEDDDLRFIGGSGGRGGSNQLTGGHGGLGEGPQMSTNATRFIRITGGSGGSGGSRNQTGGLGGSGGSGGFGGAGQRQKVGNLVSFDRKTAPRILTVGQFCQDYGVGDEILNLLYEQGFKTAGALFEVSDVSLLEHGWSNGQIAELKRALKEFLASCGINVLDEEKDSTLSGGTGGGGHSDKAGGGGLGGEGGVRVERTHTFGQQQTPLVSVSSTVKVPTLTIASFCQQYHISRTIQDRLQEEGFETAGALLELSDTQLVDAGFKRGHIAELKRALKALLEDIEAGRQNLT